MTSTLTRYQQARALLQEYADDHQPSSFSPAYALHCRVHAWLEENPDTFELDTLEQSLAFEQAQSVIECHCLNPVDPEDPTEYLETWWDLDTSSLDLSEEVDYLAFRGLLNIHPAHPRWIEIRDEDNAFEAASETAVA
jgi:hypothetical protein